MTPTTQHGDVKPGRTRFASDLRNKAAQVDWEATGRKLLLLTCLLVTAGMLVAGLWPFHSPRNQVTWLAGGQGLHFGRYGTAVSSGEFSPASAPADGPCSLEIWIKPDRPKASRTLLSVYAPDKRRQFSLHQCTTDLGLQRDVSPGRYRLLTTHSYVEDVFREGKSCFLTLTSDGRKTLAYVSGVPAPTSSNFPLSSRDLSGELILATLPRENDGWKGVWRGLAIYAEALSPAQVLHHYETWTKTGRPDVREADRPVAVYRFDEGAGRIVHNQVSSGINLDIPEHYGLVDQAFLTPFWQEFEPTSGYWLGDVAYNVVGFIPFGILVCAYFSLARPVARPALITLLLGFTLSLTIECTQAWLPTRDSGTTDLITNTLGTGIGAGIYHLSIWYAPLAKIWRRCEEKHSSLKRVDAKV